MKRKGENQMNINYFELDDKQKILYEYLRISRYMWNNQYKTIECQYFAGYYDALVTLVKYTSSNCPYLWAGTFKWHNKYKNIEKGHMVAPDDLT